MVEAQCERVRMLYRDCARPPPPPLQADRRQVGVIKCIVGTNNKHKRDPRVCNIHLDEIQLNMHIY